MHIPYVSTNTGGAMTMYSFGLNKKVVVDKFPKDAIIVICLGEIDCRCYINKYQPWEETVDRIAKNYLEAVDLNAQVNPNIWLFNVVPPPHKAKAQENQSMPYVGTDEERLSYVKRINQRLKESKYVFIDIYDQYCDKDGFMIPEKSDNCVHIFDKVPLQNWLEKKLKEVGKL